MSLADSVKMESLPVEILQHVAWLALNPELYLVSKRISTRLEPLSLFEEDLTFLLFCDRRPPDYVWSGFDCVWKCTAAARIDYRPGPKERSELQRVCLNQTWFTLEKAYAILARLLRRWFEVRWPISNMAARDHMELTDFLADPKSAIYGQYNAFGHAYFNDVRHNALGVREGSAISIYNKRSDTTTEFRLFDVLHFPDKVFQRPRTASKLRLFDLLDCLWSRPCGYTYSKPDLRRCVLDAVKDGDETLFATMFCYAMRYGVDLPKSQLFYEVYELIRQHQKWSIMKTVAEAIRLPEDFFASTLLPDLAHAMEDGDEGASDFLRWVDEFSWDHVQGRQSMYRDRQDVYVREEHHVFNKPSRTTPGWYETSPRRVKHRVCKAHIAWPRRSKKARKLERAKFEHLFAS